MCKISPGPRPADRLSSPTSTSPSGLSAPATRLATLSGGQRTRAGLADLLFAEPDWLSLDEPTNHLDIDSIEAVEAGLRAYDGALLVVSHDEAFLDAIGITRRINLCSPEPPLAPVR